jgi:hypothetical protein
VKCCGFVEFWRKLGEKTQKKWKFAKRLVENAKFFLSSRDFPSLMSLNIIKVKKPVEFRCFTQNLITFISLPGIVLVTPQMPCHCNHVIHSDKGRGVKKGSGKMGIADRDYAHGASGDGIHYLAIPSNLDSTELANFKSRARCRHETHP